MAPQQGKAEADVKSSKDTGQRERIVARVNERAKRKERRCSGTANLLLLHPPGQLPTSPPPSGRAAKRRRRITSGKNRQVN
jgi:hypothetical protein